MLNKDFQLFQSSKESKELNKKFQEYQNQYNDFFEIISDTKKDYAFLIKLLFSNGTQTFETSENNNNLINECIFENGKYCFWQNDRESNDDIFISVIKVIQNQSDLDSLETFINDTIGKYKIEQERINSKKINNNQISEFSYLYDELVDEYSSDEDEQILKKQINILYDSKNISDSKIQDILDNCNFLIKDKELKKYKLSDLIKIKDESNEKWVKSGTLILDKENNYLSYECISPNIDDAMICNINAESLNKLWNQYNHYAKNPILGMNLRYYIKKNDVDEKIKKSIKEQPSEFWIRNNGIVLLCSNYEINHKDLTLNNFSIINGGQTSHIIGSYKENEINELKDVYIPAKILKISSFDGEPDNKTIAFVNSIAISTNNQKKIDKADLIANNSYVTELEIELTKQKPEINLLSKRGLVLAKNKTSKKKYLKVKTDEVLKIIKVFNELNAGLAKNKGKLLSDKNLDDVFKKAKEQILWVKEIIFLLNAQDDVINKKVKNGFNDAIKQEVRNFIKVAPWYLIGLIKLIFICHYACINGDREKITAIKDATISTSNNSSLESKVVKLIDEEFQKISVHHLLKWNIFNDNYEDAYEKIKKEIKLIYSEGIFPTIIIEFINDIKDSDTTQSNATKLNKWFMKFVRFFITEYMRDYQSYSEILSRLFNLC